MADIINQQTDTISYEDMLRAGMHFGRKKTVFNPKMEKYVFTIKNGICIIDLLKTQQEIVRVAAFLGQTIKDNKIIVFTALTKQSAGSVKELAESYGMPFVVDRWIGGTLTNFKVINNRVKKLEEMEKQVQSGELDKYTKKERLMFDRELKKMQNNFGGLRKLSRIPDVIFVASLKDSALPVREAKIMGVKIVAIANTDANPADADYVIPANDKSKKAIDLIIQLIKEEISK